MRESFVFHSDWYVIAQGYSDEIKLSFYEGLIGYSLTRILPTLEAEPKGSFDVAKLTIDRDYEKYKKKCEQNKINGSQPKKASGFSGKRNEPDEAKEADNDNGNNNESFKKSKKRSKIFASYQAWLKQNAPYCSNPENFQQLTESELIEITDRYSIERIMSAILAIENNKRLRKKYTDLSKTLYECLHGRFKKTSTSVFPDILKTK